ncbi:hypothetical protein NX847_09655, partial [Burkholderia thailandensis]
PPVTAGRDRKPPAGGIRLPRETIRFPFFSLSISFIFASYRPRIVLAFLKEITPTGSRKT